MNNKSIESVLGSKKTYNRNTSVLLNIIYNAEKINYSEDFFFKKYDITNHQYNILRILKGATDNTLTMSEIHERMVRKLSNTTRIVDKLKSNELISRQQNKDNKRKVIITLTEKGLILVNEIGKELDKLKEFLVSELNDDEKDTLISLLEKLRI